MQAIEAIDPQTHAYLYPQCVTDSLEAKDWHQINRCDDERIHELLSILITSYIEEEDLETACFFCRSSLPNGSIDDFKKSFDSSTFNKWQSFASPGIV